MASPKLQQMSDEERKFRIKGIYNNPNHYIPHCTSLLSNRLAGVFLGSVAGVAALFGFSKTVMASKREEQKLLEKGIIEGVHLLDAGSSLAMRALGWGTLYAFLGTGTFCYGVWKLSGATNVSQSP